MITKTDKVTPFAAQAAFLPLLLASRNACEEDGRFPLDRIRMQKAVFLVTRGSRVPAWREAYPYRPYNWGPYSAELNENLASLQRRGLMLLSFAGNARHGRYVLTKAGATIARTLWQDLDAGARSFLIDVRSWVTSQDFNSLLREVYEEFPDFATKSRWTDTR